MMNDTNTKTSERNMDDYGKVPLAPFILYLTCLFFSGILVDVALERSYPVFCILLPALGFFISQAFIIYMSRNMKFALFSGVGIISALAGMLFLSFSVCDSFWILSSSCVSTLENLGQ